MKQLIFCLIFTIIFVKGIDNGLGKTPQMGWNPWNVYGCDINEQLMRQNVDALLSSGLSDAGYIYFNLDDCWQLSRDSVTNKILPDPVRFPSGMKALADYIHSKGLKFGVYSDAGFKTCEGRPGSLGYEEIDAQQYAEWEVDYLKYDNCYTDGTSPKLRYPPMSQALLKQERKIFFSMCEWGIEDPETWAGALANSWRTTGDISDNWDSFLQILDQQVGLEVYAGPGGWNDPDMLEVGNGGMSDVEYQSHFALWALLKAPLIIGCDLAKMTESTKNILLNKEVIAVNQDTLGKQGKRVKKIDNQEVWAGEIVDGVTVIFFNRSMDNQLIGITLKELGITGGTMRDLINHKDLGQAPTQINAYVEPHGVIMITIKQAKTENQ